MDRLQLGMLALGVVGGFFNAAASSGSALTLAFLLDFGLPAATATGTNRAPALVSFLSASGRFQLHQAIRWSFCLPLLFPFWISAITGALITASLPGPLLLVLARVALVQALALVLIRPQRWLAGGSEAEPSPSLLLKGLLSGVGLWSGLIGVGAPFFVLACLVGVGGLRLEEANAIKAVLLAAATGSALVVFLLRGDVNAALALPLTLGSAVGGWIGASLALGPAARIWIYRLLILALVLEMGVLLRR